MNLGGRLTELWNSLLNLEAPKVSELEPYRDGPEWTQLFRHSLATFLVSDNLVMKIGFGETLTAELNVRSIGLVVRGDAFDESKLAIAMPGDLENGRILGIPVTSSAENMREHFQQSGHRFALSTLPDRWEISFPGNFSLYFCATDERGKKIPFASNPEHSALVYCEYLFGYGGQRNIVPELTMDASVPGLKKLGS